MLLLKNEDHWYQCSVTKDTIQQREMHEKDVFTVCLDRKNKFETKMF